MTERFVAKKLDEEDGLLNCDHPRIKDLAGDNNNTMNKKMTSQKNGYQKDTNSEQILNLDSVKSDLSVLQRFYSGASVLVTGATGFMGKVLIEKLLRSCPDIDNIYMMVREKKGRSLDERIDDLISSPCFNRIKKEYPKFRSKLRAVAGDIGLPGLGISDSDKLHLQQQVDIVFHVAATVRFDEQLSAAILQNVRGTREVMNLSRTFKKLRSVVHVSTAYANCPSLQIDEHCFVPPLPSDKAIQIAETLDVDMMNYLANRLMGDWPNSYAFTKAVSEDAVRLYGQDLPVGIFRPAIVTATNSEPMAGWIDNMYGPSGVLAGVTSGLLRTMQADPLKQANIVPCDMVINALVASAWDVAENRVSNDLPIYNYVSPRENPITWADFSNFYQEYGRDFPTSRAIWYWTMTMCSSRIVFLIYRLFLHFVPAMLMDMFFLATNRKPQMIRMYTKIHKFTDVIAYFATTNWHFEDGNVVAMWKKLEPRDQATFFFDMRTLNWRHYIRDSCTGIRQFLLNDALDTLPASKVRMQRLYVLHRLTQALIACLLIWFSLMSLSSILTSYSAEPSSHIHRQSMSIK